MTWNLSPFRRLIAAIRDRHRRQGHPGRPAAVHGQRAGARITDVNAGHLALARITRS